MFFQSKLKMSFFGQGQIFFQRGEGQRMQQRFSKRYKKKHRKNRFPFQASTILSVKLFFRVSSKENCSKSCPPPNFLGLQLQLLTLIFFCPRWLRVYTLGPHHLKDGPLRTATYRMRESLCLAERSQVRFLLLPTFSLKAAWLVT